MNHIFRLTVLTLSVISCMSYAQVQHKIMDESLVDENHVAHGRNKPNYAFNSGSLFGVNKDTNLEHFRVENYIAPDRYFVNLSLNGEYLKEAWVVFDHLDASSNAVLCIDDQLLPLLDLKQQTLNRLEQKACLLIKDISPDAYYDFNVQHLNLDIYIPLTDVNVQPKGYIHPKLFDQGVNSAFIGYNANYYHSDFQESQYLSLNGGLNLGGWYFRHQGYFRTDQQGDLDHYQSSFNTLFKDIDPWKSRLSLGEFYTQGHLMDSVSMLGAQIASDDSMLPWSMRNYAPQITGVAQTNALVKVFQNGQQIYEKTVPMGEFELNDLSTTSSGDLRVEITEYGGETRVLNFPMQASFDLLKKGRFKYSVAAGRYRLVDELTDDVIGQASLSYGLSNALTMTAGMTLADLYQNYVLSGTLNTGLGAFNLISDVSQSKQDHREMDGQRYQAKYRYYLEGQKLSLNLSASKQSKQYQTANHAMAVNHYENLNPDEYYNYWLNSGLKNQYALTLSKSFSNQDWGAIQASFYRNNYWSSERDYDQYTLSYSNRWKRLNYNFGFSQSDLKDMPRTSRQDNLQEKLYFASVSMPLDWRKRNLYLNSNVQRQEGMNQYTQSNVNLSGTLGAHNQFNFGLGVSQIDTRQNKDTTFNANMNYLHPYINLGANTYVRGDELQYALSAQGGVVAHRHGVTLMNDMPRTFTIVHVDQASQANVTNAWGSKLDRFGNAIYPSSAPYQRNIIQVDPDNLPIDLTLLSNQSTVIPRMYSSTMVEFKAKKHSRYILRIHSKYGALPVGAQMHNSAGKFLGYLGQSNQILLEDFNTHQDQHLELTWGSQRTNRCQIDLDPISEEKPVEFQILAVECK